MDPLTTAEGFPIAGDRHTTVGRLPGMTTSVWEGGLAACRRSFLSWKRELLGRRYEGGWWFTRFEDVGTACHHASWTSLGYVAAREPPTPGCILGCFGACVVLLEGGLDSGALMHVLVRLNSGLGGCLARGVRELGAHGTKTRELT